MFKINEKFVGKKFTRKASMLEHTSRHKGLRDRECKVSTCIHIGGSLKEQNNGSIF